MPDTPAPVDTIMGQHPPERLRIIEQLRWISFASVVALIILGLLWELKLAPLPGGSGALAIKVLPLSFALTGVAQAQALHLPLADFAGLVVLHRGRGARNR